MRRITSIGMALVLGSLIVAPIVRAGGDDDDDEANPAALAKALAGVSVTLDQGLIAAESKGKPISAKFELEEGKLQLSVYTEKGGKFSEVIVDDKTGKVAKSEVITEGEDLTAAKAQSAAMSMAKTALRDAMKRAAAANPGYRAVSVEAKSKDGAAVAEVGLLKGDDWKTVIEKLN
jgi:uncharacterized membrane protein YkoI